MSTRVDIAQGGETSIDTRLLRGGKVVLILLCSWETPHVGGLLAGAGGCGSSNVKTFSHWSWAREETWLVPKNLGARLVAGAGQRQRLDVLGLGLARSGNKQQPRAAGKL